MPFQSSSFLTIECNEDHQATLLEKGTCSLALYTNLKQKLQFCKHFVDKVPKNYFHYYYLLRVAFINIMVLLKFLGYYFICTLKHTNKFRVCWKLKVNALTSFWNNCQKIQQNTRCHPQIFVTGWTKVSKFNGLICECIHQNQLN